MNVTINRLPTRTWNRLGMNESELSLEEDFTPYTPLAQWDKAQLLWQPDAAYTVPARFSLGNELESVTAAAGTDLAQTAADTVMTQPLLLTYRYAQGSCNASRLVLHAKKGSTLKAVLLLRSEGSEDTSALCTEIIAEENARVELYVAQLLAGSSLCLNEITGVCSKNAQVTLTRLELGAGRLYAGAQLDLQGEGSSFNAQIGYHAKEGQLLDMNYNAVHWGKHTQSLMEADGTLEDGSKKIFRGTIDFKPGCAGAKGNESENVLLLGDEMVNQTIPLILCAEEDVEGNHGASIGRLDEKVLFYLSTRGISEEAAQQMIARSRIEAICGKCPVQAVQDEIHSFEMKRGLWDESEL